jgi:hypothetical protein
MPDITALLSNFRECARHTWNCHFLALGTATFDEVDDFRDLADKLFDVLVCRPLDIFGSGLLGMATAGRIRIVPNIASGCPILIRRPRPGTNNAYWDDPVNVVTPAEADLRFVGYFDFDVCGRRDLRYFEVKILRFDSHPELLGRQALVEINDAIAELVESIPVPQSG